MDCANCISDTDQVVLVAAQIAKWLLVAAVATGVGIRLKEWWRR